MQLHGLLSVLCFAAVDARPKASQKYYPQEALGDLKTILEDASQGANLEVFAHKLLAFSEREMKWIADGTCGLGLDMTQIQLAYQGTSSCSVACRDEFEADCLNDQTIRLNSRSDICQCALNVMRVAYPVPIERDSQLIPGCLTWPPLLCGGEVVMFNVHPSHPHHKGPPVGACDAPSAAYEGGIARYCACDV